MGSSVAPSRPRTKSDDDITRALRALHAGLRRRLRRLALDGGSGEPAGTNAKGDVQRRFDVVADQWVRDWLQDRFRDGEILSEEAPAQRLGVVAPRRRFVVDPVDGSDNYSRALPLSALSVAVLALDGPIHLDRVTHALVGGLRDDDWVVAVREAGARTPHGGLATSQVRRVAEAVISCELNHWAAEPPLAHLLARCRGVRSYGCASRAITLVARGALDAHIDVRERLTPESFLAAALILREAGGHISTAHGTPLPEFESLRQRSTIVAAASRELAEEIVDALV